MWLGFCVMCLGVFCIGIVGIVVCFWEVSSLWPPPMGMFLPIRRPAGLGFVCMSTTSEWFTTWGHAVCYLSQQGASTGNACMTSCFAAAMLSLQCQMMEDIIDLGDTRAVPLRTGCRWGRLRLRSWIFGWTTPDVRSCSSQKRSWAR